MATVSHNTGPRARCCGSENGKDRSSLVESAARCELPWDRPRVPMDSSVPPTLLKPMLLACSRQEVPWVVGGGASRQPGYHFGVVQWGLRSAEDFRATQQ